MNAHAFDDMDGFPRQVMEVVGWLDREIIERERARTIIGTPDQVKTRLLEIADAYAADELMVVTITGDYASRMKSYALLAAEFGLDPAGRAAA